MKKTLADARGQTRVKFLNYWAISYLHIFLSSTSTQLMHALSRAWLDLNRGASIIFHTKFHHGCMAFAGLNPIPILFNFINNVYQHSCCFFKKIFVEGHGSITGVFEFESSYSSKHGKIKRMIGGSEHLNLVRIQLGFEYDNPYPRLTRLRPNI